MKVNVAWNGGMSFKATGETSGQSVIMDGSKEIGGQDLGPRPMEMLLMGAGGCSSIDVMMILQKGRQQVEDVRVEISAERAAEEPKVFTKIAMHFIVVGKALSEARVQKAVSLSMEKYCSASIMLGKAAELTYSYEIQSV
jgi:putative redox protein